MSLNSSQQQMHQPADLGSEASFGQDNVLRELPSDNSGISGFLRSLKQKQMAQIDRVFKSHSSKLEASEREIGSSLREIAVAQDIRRRQIEERANEEENARQEQEQYLRLMKARPQTVEEMREKVKLQLQLESRQQKSASMYSTSSKNVPVISVAPQRKVKATSNNTNNQKKKGTLWYYENPEKAQMEYAFQEYLKEKERKKNEKPVLTKIFKPLIIKPEERKKYDAFREVDYECATPCSEDRSSFAFDTGSDLIAGFKQLFDTNTSTGFAGMLVKRSRNRVKDFKDDELALIKHLFNRIPLEKPATDFTEVQSMSGALSPAPHSEPEVVSKENFEKQLLSMREILILYNIRGDELKKDLQKFSTQKAGSLTLEEAGQFLMSDRDSIISLKSGSQIILRRKKTSSNIPSALPVNPIETRISEETLSIFHDIFMEIDTFGESKVSLKQLMHKIRTDSRSKDFLDKPAAFVREVERFILLEDVFAEWDQWVSLGKEQERKQKDCVNWEGFKKMLTEYKRKSIPSRDKIFAAQRLLGRYDFSDTIEIPKELLDTIKSIVEALPKYAEYYINSNDFIAELKSNKIYTLYQSKFVRERKHEDLEIETVDDVHRRMSIECEGYHTMDELLDFFSRKGRPRYMGRLLKGKRNAALLGRKDESTSNVVGEDSGNDSGDEAARKAALKEKRKQRKVAKINCSTQEEAQKLLEKNSYMSNQQQQQQFGAQFKSKDDEFLITVPEPFNFDLREKTKVVSIRQRRLHEMLQEKQDVEDRFVATATAFRAHKIPKHVKNIKLWSEIMAKNSDRREQVKKESKAITISKENPFSFYYRDLKKVLERRNAKPEEFKQQMFKANIAPWKSLVMLYDRILARQAKKSKQNVEKRKAELLEQSKLPEGVRSMLKRLRAKDQETEKKRLNRYDEYSFAPNRAKPVPDFVEIHKNFNERMSEKKEQFTPTTVVPFRFQETRKGVNRDYLDKENLQAKKAKEGQGKEMREKKLRRILTMKVKVQPPSTKKFEAMVAKNREYQEIKENQRQLVESREIDKSLRREKFAEFVNNCIRNVNYSEYRNQLANIKAHQSAERQREKYEWEQQFDEKMTEMMRNVIRRPLLIEQVSQKSFSQEQQQQPRQIRMVMGDNGEIIEEEVDAEEDEEGAIYVPNFDQMTEQQLREYLDPETVDPQALEVRKYLYLQHIQRSGQMPHINEMDDEEEEEDQSYGNQFGHHQQYEGDEHVQDEEGNEQDEEGDYGYEEEEGQEGGEEEGEHGEDEEDFQKNSEFLEQKKQVKQMQQQQQQQHGEDIEVDQEGYHHGDDQHQLEGEEIQYEDEDDDEMYEYLDENGQPVPPEVVKQYKQQMRQMGRDPNEMFEEEGEQDFEDDDEDVEYVDEEGNVIPKEMVIQYKNESRQLLEQQQQLQQQQQQQQQHQQGRNDGENGEDEYDEYEDENSNQGNQPAALAAQQKPAVGAVGSPGHSDYEVDEDGMPIMMDDDEDDEGEPAYIQPLATLAQGKAQSSGSMAAAPQTAAVAVQPIVDYNDDDGHEEGEYGEEDFDEEDVEYVDEEGNPIDPELVKQYMEQQNQGGHMEIDGAGSSRQQENRNLQGGQIGANRMEDDQGEEEEEEDDEDVYYDEYNQRIPAEEVRRYKEMAARGEIEMEDDEGEDQEGYAQQLQQQQQHQQQQQQQQRGKIEDEDQFANEEEYIEHFVQQHIQELKALGKSYSENDIRKQITEQILLEQQQQEEIDEEIEEAIAQMTPEELAQFVDESGRPLSKEQIKYILIQQHAEGEYYDDEEEGEEQGEEEYEDQH